MDVRAQTLTTARSLGLFKLANVLQAPGIPVLCYHGFSIADEHLFRPALFIRASTFEERVRWMLSRGYRVVSLQEAIEQLESGRVQRKSMVITIDDGFHSVAKIGWPILKTYRLPATLYVTTYYAEHENPIFRLAIQYCFWKSRRPLVGLADLCPDISTGEQFAPRSADAERLMWRLINWAETSLSERDRTTLAEAIANRLDVDYGELCSSRRLSLLTSGEIEALAREGLDIQLHTHRHRLPSEPDEIIREIRDNRAVLEPLVGRKLSDLCYPSGIWDASQWETLRSLAIRSAVTCVPGINTGETPLLALRRILDSEQLDQIDFEGEISGFKMLARSLLRRKQDATFRY